MKRVLFSPAASYNALSFGLLLLRVGFGGLMLFAHGYGKLVRFADMKGKFISFMGLPSSVSLGLNIFAEFFCSILIILGLFTRLASIPIIIAMSVALFVAHGGDVLGQGQAATLYLTAFICLLFTGGGKFSLDAAIYKK